MARRLADGVGDVPGVRLHYTVECTRDAGQTVLGTGTHKRAIVPALG